MILKAADIKKSYGNLDVLKGIDLAVEKGEIVSIVGASGAGKSTLLHILGTLDKMDSGSLIINEQEVFQLSRKKLAAFRNTEIGFIFQFHHLLPEFTAIENVSIPALIAGKPDGQTRIRAEELLELVGLKERFHHKPNQLSGGEQQRVAVARALMNDPAIILADEPSGNLDSENAEKLHQIFFDLRDAMNQTFVLVTHNPELADRADRKLVIHDGKMQL